MPRYKLTVAYDGTDYCGWQKQEPPEGEPLRTVQGVLEQAVRTVVREPVLLQGASRTDSGVHAWGQVAAFSTSREIPLHRLPRAINGKLPTDLLVRDAALVPESFDPIKHCVAKGYRYRIAHSCAHSGRRPLFDRRTTSWTAYELDVPTMRDAAARLVGEHDFASFTRLHHGRESTVRTIHDCAITELARDRLQLDISGNGFLHNMIRIIAGTLIEAGRGARTPEEIEAMLNAADRRSAGPTFTPEGLCLMWVRYDPTVAPLAVIDESRGSDDGDDAAEQEEPPLPGDPD